MQVEDVMTRTKKGDTKITVNREESIDNAALLMKNKKLDAITVINDKDKVVGKITKESIIKAVDDINEDFFID